MWFEFIKNQFKFSIDVDYVSVCLSIDRERLAAHCGLVIISLSNIWVNDTLVSGSRKKSAVSVINNK